MTVISTSFPNLPKDCYQEWWFLSEAHFETESALEEGGEEIFNLGKCLPLLWSLEKTASRSLQNQAV